MLEFFLPPVLVRFECFCLDGQQLLPRPPSSANKYMKYNHKYNENLNGLVFCTLSACVASDIRLKVSNFTFTLFKKE